MNTQLHLFTRISFKKLNRFRSRVFYKKCLLRTVSEIHKLQIENLIKNVSSYKEMENEILFTYILKWLRLNLQCGLQFG